LACTGRRSTKTFRLRESWRGVTDSGDCPPCVEAASSVKSGTLEKAAVTLNRRLKVELP
jgi:hypothetical protein